MKNRRIINGFTTIGLHDCGFTLTEILVVISIMAILSTIGLGTYIRYNREQIINQTISNVVNDLRSAQSLASNQEKPAECTLNCSLVGYNFNVLGAGSTDDPYRYEIKGECDCPPMVNHRFVLVKTSPPFPTSLRLVGNHFTSVQFKVLHGGAVLDGNNSLGITGYNIKKYKNITVENGGAISLSDWINTP